MNDQTPFAASPLSAVEILLPRGAEITTLLEQRPFVPFAPEVLAFIEALGRSLLTDPAVRQFPELVALGFWARAANLKQLKARFDAAYPSSTRLARGLALHVAPSNVDTIFVYSLLLSMLAGNVNIVRISSRAGEQSSALLTLLERAIDSAPPELVRTIGIVRYPHDKQITDTLSSSVDLRVIWGGDATVSLIRQSPLAAAGTELVFPNRYSLSVMKARAWLDCTDQGPVVRNFLNDALWFGQMACSSPRALVWLGTDHDVAAASASFWPQIEAAAATANFPWEDAQAVAKLLAEQGAAIDIGATVVPLHGNFVRVIRCSLDHLGEENAAAGGFFREFAIDALDALASAVRRNWQTVSSFGVTGAEWTDFLNRARPAGIDRIAPFGSALNFDAIWDGVDLLAAMTRIVSVGV